MKTILQQNLTDSHSGHREWSCAYQVIEATAIVGHTVNHSSSTHFGTETDMTVSRRRKTRNCKQKWLFLRSSAALILTEQPPHQGRSQIKALRMDAVQKLPGYAQNNVVAGSLHLWCKEYCGNYEKRAHENIFFYQLLVFWRKNALRWSAGTTKKTKRPKEGKQTFA